MLTKQNTRTLRVLIKTNGKGDVMFDHNNKIVQLRIKIEELIDLWVELYPSEYPPELLTLMKSLDKIHRLQSPPKVRASSPVVLIIQTE